MRIWSRLIKEEVETNNGVIPYMLKEMSAEAIQLMTINCSGYIDYSISIRNLRKKFYSVYDKKN